MLPASLNFEELSPFAIFGLFAVGAWWVLDMLASGKSRAQERLDELKNPQLRRREDGAPVKKSDAMAKAFEKASPALASPLQPKNELEVSKIRSKLAHAGFRSESAGQRLLGLKFVGLMVGLVIGGLSLLATMGITQQSMAGHRVHRRRLFYLPDIVLLPRFEESQAVDLPRTARRARPDGRLRRGRPRARPGHAQGQRRNETDHADHLRGVRVVQLPIADRVVRAPKCCTNWAFAPASTTCGRLLRS